MISTFRETVERSDSLRARFGCVIYTPAVMSL